MDTGGPYMPEHIEIEQLRRKWALLWGKQPHKLIGRVMLEKSIEFKIFERDGFGLNAEQQSQLDQLIQDYKRNPKLFDNPNNSLKPGTRLVKTYQGQKHSVLVTESGFEYEGQLYSSLSKIANDITGKRWNGWVFFGLKKVGVS